MKPSNEKRAKEELERLLNEPIKNIIQSYYDDYVKENAKLSAELGLKAIIIRREVGKCCDWCANLAGVYEYGEHPDDVFRRHDYCRCMVLYKEKKGKYTDVWSKKKFETERAARIEKIKEFEKEDSLSEMTRKNLRPYFDKATPGKGSLIFEDGWDKGENGQAEIRYARNLFDRFGGELILQKKRDEIKWADYLWNGKLWEHKHFKKFSGIDGRVQDAIKQIKSNPGGIILENRYKVSLNLEEAKKDIIHRLLRTGPKYGVNKADVFIFEEDSIILAIHWEN